MRIDKMLFPNLEPDVKSVHVIIIYQYCNFLAETINSFAWLFLILFRLLGKFVTKKSYFPLFYNSCCSCTAIQIFRRYL